MTETNDTDVPSKQIRVKPRAHGLLDRWVRYRASD